VKLSVPIIARNVVKLNYPLDRVVASVEGLADEIVIAVDPTSDDCSVEYVEDLQRRHASLRMIKSVWDLNNITDTGAEFARQTNIAINKCDGDWIFSLQCDEAVHEEDHALIRNVVERAEARGCTDAFKMLRIYFFGDINTVRNDWTVFITRLFKKGTRYSSGDAMNTSPLGDDRTGEIYAPIYHYSRIGNPDDIAQRILSLDRLFHDEAELLAENDLQPYDFSTANFDCMHKAGVDVGRKFVDSELSPFEGTHPAPFVGYTGDR
jgi:hypothetical protein